MLLARSEPCSPLAGRACLGLLQEAGPESALSGRQGADAYVQEHGRRAREAREERHPARLRGPLVIVDLVRASGRAPCSRSQRMHEQSECSMAGGARADLQSCGRRARARRLCIGTHVRTAGRRARGHLATSAESRTRCSQSRSATGEPGEPPSRSPQVSAGPSHRANSLARAPAPRIPG